MTVDTLNTIYPLLQRIMTGTNAECARAHAELDRIKQAVEPGDAALIEVVSQTYAVGIAHGMAHALGGVKDRCDALSRRAEGLSLLSRVGVG